MRRPTVDSPHRAPSTRPIAQRSTVSGFLADVDLRELLGGVRELASRLRADHQVLDVEGRRISGYSTTYFETDKRQTDHPPGDRTRLTDQARECLRGALHEAGLEPPDELAASLTTSFQRVTLAARAGGGRVTCDFGVKLTASDGQAAEMAGGLILVEAKSENGDSPADQVLAQLQVWPVSLSKYRVGMSLVGGVERFGPQPGSELFEK